MECVCCGSTAVTERPERTAQGYRRFRCRDCGRQFNERSAGALNRTQHPSDVIALVVLWRPRYRLTLRDLCEMFLLRGIVFRWGGRPPTASVCQDAVVRTRSTGAAGDEHQHDRHRHSQVHLSAPRH